MDEEAVEQLRTLGFEEWEITRLKYMRSYHDTLLEMREMANEHSMLLFIRWLIVTGRLEGDGFIYQ